jgi:hypothetical protein
MYAYVNSQPVTAIDPEGLRGSQKQFDDCIDTCDSVFAVTSGAGAIGIITLCKPMTFVQWKGLFIVNVIGWGGCRSACLYEYWHGDPKPVMTSKK